MEMNDNDCVCCFESIDEDKVVILDCNHHFCKPCVVKWVMANGNGHCTCGSCNSTVSCPICRQTTLLSKLDINDETTETDTEEEINGGREYHVLTVEYSDDGSNISRMTLELRQNGNVIDTPIDYYLTGSNDTQ